MRNAHAIAAASPRIAAGCIVGESGLAADLGLPMAAPWDAATLAYHRGEADLAARALGLSPDGHRGAVVVHPSQVEKADQAFTPRTEQVQEALAVVYAFEEADRNGEPYGVHRGRIVDARVAAAARDLLVHAEECAAKDADKMQRAMLRQQAEAPDAEGDEAQPSDPDRQSQPPDPQGKAPDRT